MQNPILHSLFSILHSEFCILHSTWRGTRTYRQIATLLTPAFLLLLILGEGSAWAAEPPSRMMVNSAARTSATATPAIVTAPQLRSAVSRRLHSGVPYDVALPQGGAGAVECRQLSQGL